MGEINLMVAGQQEPLRLADGLDFRKSLLGTLRGGFLNQLFPDFRHHHRHGIDHPLLVYSVDFLDQCVVVIHLELRTRLRVGARKTDAALSNHGRLAPDYRQGLTLLRIFDKILLRRVAFGHQPYMDTLDGIFDRRLHDGAGKSKHPLGIFGERAGIAVGLAKRDTHLKVVTRKRIEKTLGQTGCQRIPTMHGNHTVLGLQ